MDNQELFDAIAFTWQAAENANKGYCTANNDRARLMFDHLKELLAVQLDRAKKNYDTTIDTTIDPTKNISELIKQEFIRQSRAGGLLE